MFRGNIDYLSGQRSCRHSHSRRRNHYSSWRANFSASRISLEGQKLKSLPPLGHVHQLFQRYKEFLGIRRWRSSDLDTLPVRDSVMNSQTVASSVIPHVSKLASNLNVSQGTRKFCLSRVQFTIAANDIATFLSH